MSQRSITTTLREPEFDTQSQADLYNELLIKKNSLASEGSYLEANEVKKRITK